MKDKKLPPPPLPPPADEAVEEEGKKHEELVGRKVRLMTDKYGEGTYGSEAVVMYETETTVKGQFAGRNVSTKLLTVSKEDVIEREVLWKRPLIWQKPILSRRNMQMVLMRWGFLENCDLGLPTDDENINQETEEIELYTNKTTITSDAQLCLLLSMLEWHFTANWKEEGKMKLILMDPLLLERYCHCMKNIGKKEELSDEEVQFATQLGECIKKQVPEQGVMECAIHAGFHWALLSITVKEKKCLSVRYYDSLQEESELCRESAQLVLQCIHENKEVTLPARESSQTQISKSNLCGIYTLANMENDIAVHYRNEGKASRGSLEFMISNLELQAIAWTKTLKEEQGQARKCHLKELAAWNDKAKKAQERQSKLAELAKAKGDAATKMQKEALALLSETKFATPADLPAEYKHKIQQVEMSGDLKICSRCKYSSSCLSCDVSKATSYYMRCYCKMQGIPVPKQYQSNAKGKKSTNAETIGSKTGISETDPISTSSASSASGMKGEKQDEGGKKEEGGVKKKEQGKEKEKGQKKETIKEQDKEKEKAKAKAKAKGKKT